MSDTETEMITEPDWLAAKPSARAKLTAILAAVVRCQEECNPTWPRRTVRPSGPHLTITMAEVFIRQLLMTSAADERERLANRAGMVDEVKDELTDAFQFAEPDGQRFSHVSRAWVEALLATAAASGAAAECERIRKLAAEHEAIYIKGGHTHPFADLLKEDSWAPTSSG